jgi:hypothetical protein
VGLKIGFDVSITGFGTARWFGASDLMQSCCVVTMPPCFNHVARRLVFGDVVVVVVVVSSIMYCDALYIDFQVFIESMYICLFELA